MFSLFWSRREGQRYRENDIAQLRFIAHHYEALAGDRSPDAKNPFVLSAGEIPEQKFSTGSLPPDDAAKSFFLSAKEMMKQIQRFYSNHSLVADEPMALFCSEFQAWIIGLCSWTCTAQHLAELKRREQYLSALDRSGGGQLVEFPGHFGALLLSLRGECKRFGELFRKELDATSARETLTSLHNEMKNICHNIFFYLLHVLRDSVVPDKVTLADLDRSNDNGEACLEIWSSSSWKLLSPLYDYLRKTDQDCKLEKLSIDSPPTYLSIQGYTWQSLFLVPKCGVYQNLVADGNTREKIVEAFIHVHDVLAQFMTFTDLVRRARRLAGRGGDFLLYGKAGCSTREFLASFSVHNNKLQSNIGILTKACQDRYSLEQRLRRDHYLANFQFGLSDTWRRNFSIASDYGEGVGAVVERVSNLVSSSCDAMNRFSEAPFDVNQDADAFISCVSNYMNNLAVGTHSTHTATAPSAAAQALAPTKQPESQQPEQPAPPATTAIDAKIAPTDADTPVMAVAEAEVAAVEVGQKATACLRQFQNADECSACSCKFGIFVRKHHCRNCTKTFCGEHSRYKIPKVLAGDRCDRDRRLCAECFAALRIRLLASIEAEGKQAQAKQKTEPEQKIRPMQKVQVEHQHKAQTEAKQNDEQTAADMRKPPWQVEDDDDHDGPMTSDRKVAFANGNAEQAQTAEEPKQKSQAEQKSEPENHAQSDVELRQVEHQNKAQAEGKQNVHDNTETKHETAHAEKASQRMLSSACMSRSNMFIITIIAIKNQPSN